MVQAKLATSMWCNMLRLVSRILLAWLFEWKAFAAEPSFGIPATNITVVKGDTAVLPCPVLHLTDDHQVVWTDASGFVLTHNDRRVIDDQRLSVERPLKKDWDLHIRDVQYSDRGKYICQISTKPVKHKVVILEVLVPPHIVDQYSSYDMTVQEGDTVTLICNATGVPLPEISWYRVNTDVNKGNQLIGSKGEALKIHNVSRECGGMYVCVANNVVAELSRKISIFVEYAPEVHLRVKKMGQPIGRETILQCEVTAHPHGIMYWEKNGVDLTSDKTGKYHVEVYSANSDDKKIMTVRIRELQQDDFGNYTCVAKSILGEDKESMLLYDYSNHTRKFNSTLKPITVSVSDGPSTMTLDSKRPGYNEQTQNGRRKQDNSKYVSAENVGAITGKSGGSTTKLVSNILCTVICLTLQKWSTFQLLSFNLLTP